MALPNNLGDREVQKFEEIETSKVAVRTTARVNGLATAGLVTVVALNAVTWTALPTTALTDRNALSIQNRSGIEIKINYASTVVGYVGIVIDDGADRFYDITPDIVLYGKSESGTPSVNVEELS